VHPGEWGNKSTEGGNVKALGGNQRKGGLDYSLHMESGKEKGGGGAQTGVPKRTTPGVPNREKKRKQGNQTHSPQTKDLG